MFKPINKHLRRFLVTRGLYLQFLLNIVLGAASIKDFIYKRNSLATVSPYNISTAFDSDTCIEGFDYWYSVNRKWEIEYGMLLMAGIITPYESKPDDNESEIS